MVLCHLADACLDQSSKPSFRCIGCNKPFHAFCIGISRQAYQFIDDFTSILKCVCEECNDLTTTDLVRMMRSVDDKLHRELQTKHDTSRINASNIQTTDEAIEDIKSGQDNLATNLMLLKETIENHTKETKSLVDEWASLQSTLKENLQKMSSSVQILTNEISNCSKTVANSRAVDISQISSATEDLKQTIESVLVSNINKYTDQVLLHVSDQALNQVELIFKPVQAGVDLLHNGLDEARSKLAGIAASEALSNRSCDGERNMSLLDELLHAPANDFNETQDDSSSTTYLTMVTDNESGKYVRLRPDGHHSKLVLNPFADPKMSKKIKNINQRNQSNLSVQSKAKNNRKNPQLVMIKNTTTSRTGQWVMEKINPAHKPANFGKAKGENKNRSSYQKYGDKKRKPNDLSKPTQTTKRSGKRSQKQKHKKQTGVRDSEEVHAKRKPEMSRTRGQTVTESSLPLKSYSQSMPSTLSYIYATGFRNDITAAEVRRFVQRKLSRDYVTHVTCQVLLKRGVDPSTKKFLSFKLGIPTAATKTVLGPDFWPSNITARNFYINRQERITRSLFNRN